MTKSKRTSKYTVEPLVANPTKYDSRNRIRKTQNRKLVAYYYHPDIGDFYYGRGHPMKPHRVKMTQNIVLSYDLHHYMEMYVPQPATFEDLTQYHTVDFIKCLQFINPQNKSRVSSTYKNFFKNFGDEDIPVFEGMFEYCQIYTGGSLGAAARIINQENDIVINWAGGLHHAKKGEASGFCYVNDIVISIMELLKYYHRVMYIDIDVHHGDGVEEAFLTTDRVMTLSFHKFDGDFFPGTGSLDCVGLDDGKYYKINVPLSDGIDDDSYYYKLFNPIVTRAVERFKPSVLVMQCGADSLAGDSLGHFNLSVEGHARCLKMVKGFGLPLIVMGGGGYKIPNVARCWAYETATVLDQDQTISDYIPINHHYSVYGPDAKLRLKAKKDMINLNSEQDIDTIRTTVMERLNYISPTCAHIKEVEMADYENQENDILNLFNRSENVKQQDYYDQTDVFSSQDSAEGEDSKYDRNYKINMKEEDIKVVSQRQPKQDQASFLASETLQKSQEPTTNKSNIVSIQSKENNTNNYKQIKIESQSNLLPKNDVQIQDSNLGQKIPINKLNAQNQQQWNFDQKQALPINQLKPQISNQIRPENHYQFPSKQEKQQVVSPHLQQAYSNHNYTLMNFGNQSIQKPQIKIYDKQKQSDLSPEKSNHQAQVIELSSDESESKDLLNEQQIQQKYDKFMDKDYFRKLARDIIVQDIQVPPDQVVD